MSNINDWLRIMDKNPNKLHGINEKLFPENSPAIKYINQQRKFHQTFNSQIFPEGSNLLEFVNKHKDFYQRMNNQIPRNVREYQKISNNNALQQSLKSLQEFNNKNKLSSPKAIEMQSFLKNIQGFNNSKLNSQINQMTKLFGSPGSELSDYQKENISNLKSNFSFDEFDDAMSKNPDVSENGNGNDDLKQSHNSNPVSDVKSQVDVSRNPNPEEEVPNKSDTVKPTLSKEDLKYFNELSGNDISLLPWSILATLISVYVGTIASPIPVMIVSFAISATNIIITNAKK